LHILINDFIGGVLDRGIPLYVRNLIYGLEEEGFRVTVVRAPAFLRKLPRNLFYFLSVSVEQFILPLIGFVARADLTIYPYNAIAVLDILSGRGRIVVHDLEILDRPLSSPSKLYCLACYGTLRRFAYPVFTIADLIREKMRVAGVFGDCRIGVLPNTFYLFENLLRAEPATSREKTILLCTGSTENKDLAAVVADYLPMVLDRGFAVSILGLHKKTDLAVLDPLRPYLASGQLQLCGQLSDSEVARAYKAHEIVWVHSRREGFGRCVVEGRLAGRPVIASAIPEFATLKDDAVYLYQDAADFSQLLAGLPRTAATIPSYTGYPYRELLRNAVRSGL
jgi:glycosyltransferase involved in cell wall biosynthesis